MSGTKIGRAAAHSELLRAIAVGDPVPCQGPRADNWTAEDRASQVAAARECRRCPALLACGNYARKWCETGGVWAGRRPTKPKPSTQPKG